MRAVLALLALALLAGPAVATFGDNGLTTYTGRKRENNTLVFGNDMVIQQAVQAHLSFFKDIMKGTFSPSRNDPAIAKHEVSFRLDDY